MVAAAPATAGGASSSTTRTPPPTACCEVVNDGAEQLFSVRSEGSQIAELAARLVLEKTNREVELILDGGGSLALEVFDHFGKEDFYTLYKSRKINFFCRMRDRLQLLVR